jgi:hypothetical protein
VSATVNTPGVEQCWQVRCFATFKKHRKATRLYCYTDVTKAYKCCCSQGCVLNGTSCIWEPTNGCMGGGEVRGPILNSCLVLTVPTYFHLRTCNFIDFRYTDTSFIELKVLYKWLLLQTRFLLRVRDLGDLLLIDTLGSAIHTAYIHLFCFLLKLQLCILSTYSSHLPFTSIR